MDLCLSLLMFYLVMKSGVSSITIHNFSPVNSTDLSNLVEGESGKFLAPFIRQMISAQKTEKATKSEEASPEEVFPLPPVFRDEKKNVFFDIWVIRGKENRIMSDNRGHLCVSVLSPSDVEDSFNMELWRFISNVLQVRRDEVEIVLSDTNDMARRVVVKSRAITEGECQQRLHANMRRFSLEIQEEAGAEESAKLDELFFHAEIKSKFPSGPAPEVSGEDIHPGWAPNYIKNPTMLDRVLRDLMPNQEIIIRGRLLKKSNPNFVARPLLENYQGRKSLKVKRKILEGIRNKEVERKKDFPTGPRMSCPDRIPGLSVIDTLSQDGSRVISRRVFSPLFQNKTHDFIDELDYSEVQYKTSL